MTSLAIRRLLTYGAGGSHAQVEIEEDQPAAIDDRPSQTPAWRSPRTLRLLSLAPFAVPIVEIVFVREYMPLLLEAPPAIVGAPFALVLELMLLGWAALGAALVWRAKSPRLAQLAVLLFAPAAIVGLAFRPDLIVLMRNMAV